ACRAECVEGRSHGLDLGEPPGVQGRAAVVPALTEEPFVVLARAGPVVLKLLPEDVLHRSRTLSPNQWLCLLGRDITRGCRRVATAVPTGTPYRAPRHTPAPRGAPGEVSRSAAAKARPALLLSPHDHEQAVWGPSLRQGRGG